MSLKIACLLRKALITKFTDIYNSSPITTLSTADSTEESDDSDDEPLAPAQLDLFIHKHKASDIDAYTVWNYLERLTYRSSS